jgi:long-chain fatty acid transport protein
MKEKQIARLVAATLGMVAAGSAFASGFQLLEQSASGLGEAFAGSGANAEDASTAYFNPASMVFMPKRNQISAGIVMIKPELDFRNTGSTPAALTTSGGDGDDAAPWAGVPNVHATWGVTENISLGFSAGAPFGLRTEYDENWRGRFLADKSDLKAKNFNPSIAWKITPKIAVGAGASYQTFDAELTQAINFSALMCGNPAVAQLCGAGLLNNNDGLSSVKGSSDAWGWNIGLALQPSDTTRVGVSYRSAIKHHLTGDLTVSYPNVALPAGVPNGDQTAAALNAGIRAALPSGPVQVDVKLPDTWTISAFQQLDDKWTLSGDVSRTGWSSLQSLDIYRSNGQLVSSTPYNWKNTWRLTLGGTYQLNEQWKLRAGGGYDESPVPDQYRHARLPDSDRTWLSVGANWAITKAISLDAAYTHLFMRDVPINETSSTPAATGTLVGEYAGYVDMIGLQMNYAF